jgi:2-dehydro-3-deoxyphosphogluconate aldolase / (4S)-4-hydroxy-2-oxoglutarate aldolase
LTADRSAGEHPVLAALRAQRVMAIVRADGAEQAYVAASRLIDAGIRAVEVSLSTPQALDAVERLARRHAGDVTIGAGTVLDPVDVGRAAGIGASFIVAPTLNPAVVTVAAGHGLASFPGCATPSEMWHATELGATGVKIFPASLWTPQAMADLRHALPGLRCVPTGGVRLEDVPAWLAAGALAVGLGSALADESAVARVLEAGAL